MVYPFYRLFLPCTTKIVFSAYVSAADKCDLVDIQATNCIVVAQLTKFAIFIFLGKIENPLNFFQHFYWQIFKEIP